MKALLATTCVAAALVAGGCATKKYVRTTTAPIQAKVDQVGEQTGRNSQQIEETRSQVKQVDEKAQSGISAAQERAAAAGQRAATADQHAGEAAASAGQANQLGERNQQGLSSLRQVVANIDDYQLGTTSTVQFGFNKSGLTDEAKAELDKVAAAIKAAKRYFVAVQGYTDSVGNAQYNENLSRKRADAVVAYLVGKHDIPVFRVHQIGLGNQKLVDEGKNSAARAKNRRVEVALYTADAVVAGLSK